MFRQIKDVVMQQGQASFARFLKPLFIVLPVLVVAFVAYQVVRSQRFHVVSTYPSTSNVATVSPFLKINFNKTLSRRGLSIASSYSVAKSYKIEGKVLVVTLKSPMTADYSYYIKINNISDIYGHKINNEVFSFVPKFMSSQDLPKDQQQALLQAQAQVPKSKSNVVFNGTGVLINNGVTATQLDELEQEFFSFDPNEKVVSVVSNSVVQVPHDRNSASTLDTINFSVQIDSKSYGARIDYSLLYDTIRLYLYNPQTNALVFDSNTLS